MLSAALSGNENGEPQHFVAQINDITVPIDNQRKMEALNHTIG